MTKKVYSYHFSNGKLTGHPEDDENYGKLVVPGLKLACLPTEVGLCKFGFHGSRRIMDAARWSQWRHDDTVLSLCMHEGHITESEDKLASSKRTHLAVAEISDMIQEFARWMGHEYVDYLEQSGIAMPTMTTAIMRNALEVQRKWRANEVTLEELRIARNPSDGATRGTIIPHFHPINRVCDSDHLDFFAVASSFAYHMYDIKCEQHPHSGMGNSYDMDSPHYVKPINEQEVYEQTLAIYAHKLTEMIFDLPEFAPFKDLFTEEKTE